MVTVKLGELRGIVEGLNEVVGEKLPVKTAYSMSKLARRIQKEIAIYEEQRRRLLERYCTRDEKGKPLVENGQYKIADPQGFGKDFAELAGIETKIEFEPITLDALGDIQVRPAALLRLEKFITD